MSAIDVEVAGTCVAVCCSVLQCVAVCCSGHRDPQKPRCQLSTSKSLVRVLQCAAVCCSVLQLVAVCCSASQCVAVRCSAVQCVAVCCSVLQCIAVHCSALQCVAVSTHVGDHRRCYCSQPILLQSGLFVRSSIGWRMSYRCNSFSKTRMTDSTGNATSPKSTKSRNSHFSVQTQIHFVFVPRDTEKSEILDLVDLRK
jgi:hypothetical protein